MKRSAALQPLSRDHHQALFVAQRLKRADEESRADATQAFLEFWNDHGRRHFRDEEEILLPAYAEYGDAHDPLVARVLTDHVEIRHRTQRLAAAGEARSGTGSAADESGLSQVDGPAAADAEAPSPASGDFSDPRPAAGAESDALALPPPGSPEDLNQIGELLADHVRREERELFPMIEAGMPDAAASELASIFIAAEQERGTP